MHMICCVSAAEPTQNGFFVLLLRKHRRRKRNYATLLRVHVTAMNDPHVAHLLDVAYCHLPPQLTQQVEHGFGQVCCTIESPTSLCRLAIYFVLAPVFFLTYCTTVVNLDFLTSTIRHAFTAFAGCRRPLTALYARVRHYFRCHSDC